MADEWRGFVNQLKDDAESLAKGELFGLITSSKDDSEEFVRRQAEKVEKYLNQLALGEITKDDLVLYMRQIQRLNEMQALKLSVAAKASTQRLTSGIQNLILDKLLKLIP